MAGPPEEDDDEDDACAEDAFFFRNCSREGPFLPSGSSGGMNLQVQFFIIRNWAKKVTIVLMEYRRDGVQRRDCRQLSNIHDL